MQIKLKFSLPDDCNQQQLINALTEYYAIKQEQPVLKNLAIYDTFDWRLFNKSLVLYTYGNMLFLRKLFKNDSIHNIEITLPPGFVWDLPDSKLKIQLYPALRSDEATKKILRYLFQIMKINEATLEKDLDTEVLHDFRVAIRRTRSALDQMKSVFPQHMTRRFKKEFAFVGKLSNQLRDIDVYLLKEDSFKTILPSVLRDDIEPLFDYLKKSTTVLEKTIHDLKSKRYAQIMQDWEAFLDDPVQAQQLESNAGVPILFLARKRTHKQYRRILKDGQSILDNTEDEALHTLRIACKKLRYLMEFFSSLFPAKKIKRLIAQLKTLQDNLGDFNDLCVQEKYLLSIIEELPATGQKQKKVLVAIGCLIGVLEREKQRIKNEFAKTFTNYASPKNKNAFSELFVSKQKGSYL